MSRYYKKGWIRPRKTTLPLKMGLVTGASLTAISFAVAADAIDDPRSTDVIRAEANQILETGGCSAARDELLVLARRTALALDYIRYAECQVAAGDAEAAADGFWDAVRHRNQLEPEQQMYVYRALAYQSEAAGQFSRAAIGWREAARLSDAPVDHLMSARADRLDGRPQAGSARLQQLSPAQFAGAELALYFEERSNLLAENQPDAAAMYLERAIAEEDRPYRQYQLGLLRERAGNDRGALQAFALALEGEPQNTDIILSTAYAARRVGDHNLAADLFARAIALQPERTELLEDRGYTLMRADREEDAIESFRLSIAQPEQREDETLQERDERIYRLRRQVETLERSTSGLLYASYRNGSAPVGFDLPETGPNETQIGGEFAWRPDALGTVNTGLTLFGRGYVSAEPDTFNLDTQTLQLGIGARWKPLAEHDFYLSAERLIAAGDLARDAWLLRASYGWSDGLDWNPTRDDWNYTTLFADLAYIPDSPEFTSAYAAVRQGRRYRTADRWAVTPYLTAVAQWSDDSFQTRERFEIGPGVVISHWFDEDAFVAPRQRVDFEFEYRLGVGDTDDNAFIARAVWNF